MQVKKPPLFPFLIPEYYLHWTFQNRRLLAPQLRTLSGESLAILEPGVYNPAEGPDFQNALLDIGGIRMRGDVECHLRWQDWYRHGHQHDRRYRQVVLHVLWELPGELPEALASRFQHLILARSLNLPRQEWLRHMEKLKQDAAGKDLSCPGHWLTPANLQSVAWRRFRRKCSELASWVNHYGWETALYIGLGRVLGYSKNSAPFMRLVQTLPPERLLALVPPIQRSPLLFYILMGWQSGLFNRPLRLSAHDSSDGFRRTIAFVRDQFAGRLPLHHQTLLQWQFGRLRPQNSPYLRLAGLAQIIHDYQQPGLFRHLSGLFQQRLPLNRLLPEIEQTVCRPLSPAFGPFLQSLLRLKQIPAHSMGKRRCRLFALNILLPLFHLWAEHRQSVGFQWYLKDLYFQFPAVDQNHVLKRILSATDRNIPQKAYVHQALLEYQQQRLPAEPA